MWKFTITPTKDRHGKKFLDREVQAYFHSEYSSGAGQWQKEGTIENIICTLKNDITPYPETVLKNVCKKLENILKTDLPHILKLTGKDKFVVCAIPRAKVNYNPNQLYFKKTVGEVADRLSGFVDGTDLIVRTIDTKTTHRAKYGYGGNGDMPYPGITINTCDISDDIKDKDILLIDDLYTNSVNIDEDAIQALYEKGAKSVIFYSIGAKLAL
jgi:hypothetical protein